MKFYYSALILICTSLMTSEQKREESVSPLSSMIAQVALAAQAHNTIHNLTSSDDLAGLLSAHIKQGDRIRIKQAPDLTKKPQSYVHYGIAERDPIIIPDPEHPGYFFYEMSRHGVSIYSQYQRCENGKMLIPTNEFFDIEIGSNECNMEED